MMPTPGLAHAQMAFTIGGQPPQPELATEFIEGAPHVQTVHAPEDPNGMATPPVQRGQVWISA